VTAPPELRGSLRRTLLAWLLPPLLLIVAAGAAVQYELTARPAVASLDHALDDVGLVLGQMIRWHDGAAHFGISPETEAAIRTDNLDTVYFAVLDPQRRLIGGDAALAALAIDAPTSDFVGSDHLIGGAGVRVVARRVACAPPGAGDCEVRVAETMAKRQLIRRQALLAGLAALALLVAATSACVVLALRFALRPLDALARQIAHRSLDDLRDVRVDGAPHEVAPLLESINRLFARVREAARAQREFLANAAHQLRTPLTALRTEAELAVLEPHPPSMAPTLQRLLRAADRASRLTHQMLLLARVGESAQADVSVEPVDLVAVASACARDWAPRAIERGADLGFELQPAQTLGRPFLLQEMLSNLIDNAIKYAGAKATITVRTAEQGEHALVEVEDNGPGVPPAARAPLLERFRRGGGSPAQGSGLGLAIVQDIAALHGGEVALLDAAGGGLRVRVALPRRPRAAALQPPAPGSACASSSSM